VFGSGIVLFVTALSLFSETLPDVSSESVAALARGIGVDERAAIESTAAFLDVGALNLDLPRDFAVSLWATHKLLPIIPDISTTNRVPRRMRPTECLGNPEGSFGPVRRRTQGLEAYGLRSNFVIFMM